MVCFRAPKIWVLFLCSFIKKVRTTYMKPKPEYRHLTAGDRIRISEMLCRGESLRFIAKELGKSTSTISREIKKHSVTKHTKANDCLYKNECSKTGICNKPTCTRKYCRRCRVLCKKYCQDYTQSFCDKLSAHPTYVTDVKTSIIVLTSKSFINRSMRKMNIIKPLFPKEVALILPQNNSNVSMNLLLQC